MNSYIGCRAEMNLGCLVFEEVKMGSTGALSSRCLTVFVRKKERKSFITDETELIKKK